MDELLTHWGIDARAQKTLSRPVKALEQAEWVRKVQAVYPVGKLLALENGLVRVRLIVDPEGKPSSCHIQMKAKDDDFEQAACGTMMRHARFEPALDASGKPIASYFVTSVIYRVN
jgi:TonB family protein